MYGFQFSVFSPSALPNRLLGWLLLAVSRVAGSVRPIPR
jgi:hypothetical protein